jgi:membrane carboxypeptidase/penicillin-binding protein
MAEGTGKGAAKYGVGRGAAGKSGTTDGYKDAWFAGVAGNYAVIVWVGFDRNQPVGLTGSKAALPAWARFVASTGLGTSIAGPPAGLEQAEVCELTGEPPCPSCESTRMEWFSTGTVPARVCGIEAALRFGEDRVGPWKALGRLLGLDRDPEAPPDDVGPDGVRMPE